MVSFANHLVAFSPISEFGLKNMTLKHPAPLRILHILDHSLPVQSGYAFRSQAILQAQQKLGWQPSAITSPKHYESWQGEPSDKELVGLIEYHRTPFIPRGCLPIKKEVQIMAALARRLNALVCSERPDILHAHSPILNAIPALLLRRKTGIPVIYEMRSSWEDAAVDRRSYSQNSWKYRLARSLETWVCKRADHVAVLCEGLKTDLIARGVAVHHITPIPNGVDPDTFSAASPNADLLSTWKLSGKKVVGFMGSFFRWEGLDLLIDAIARIADERRDIALLLVGGGEMEGELKEKIKRLHLETHVVMPGSVPQERIPGLYALVDVVAFPRYSTRLTEMVTPLKPLEAMAMGKAVVASDVGGHRELIQHGRTGLLFRAGDVSALTTELMRILNDSNLRQSLEREGMLWVRQARSWGTTTAGYAGIYEKVLSQDPGAPTTNLSLCDPHSKRGSQRDLL